MNVVNVYDKYVFVPTDNALNNIVFACKLYFYERLVKELGINEHLGNPTYKKM